MKILEMPKKAWVDLFKLINNYTDVVKFKASKKEFRVEFVDPAYVLYGMITIKEKKGNEDVVYYYDEDAPYEFGFDIGDALGLLSHCPSEPLLMVQYDDDKTVIRFLDEHGLDIWQDLEDVAVSPWPKTKVDFDKCAQVHMSPKELYDVLNIADGINDCVKLITCAETSIFACTTESEVEFCLDGLKDIKRGLTKTWVEEKDNETAPTVINKGNKDRKVIVSTDYLKKLLHDVSRVTDAMILYIDTNYPIGVKFSFKNVPITAEFAIAPRIENE